MIVTKRPSSPTNHVRGKGTLDGSASLKKRKKWAENNKRTSVPE
jgi:hypothetical protein